MTFTLAQRLLAAGALCLAALIFLVVSEARARAAGTEIILRMQPVDPRALLTGHYIQLSFAEPLDRGEACPPLVADDLSTRTRAPNETRWLALKPDGDLHALAGEYLTKEAALAHAPVVARGSARCDSVFMPLPGATDGAGEERVTIVLELPVDRFHADQDEAEALEKILRDRAFPGRLAAILSVTPDGAVRTKGIMIDDRRVELSWF